MTEMKEKKPELKELDSIVIRFAGDSGDGMQLTGTQFTNTSAVLGNDISTYPDFPAEIRAPAGTIPGVSGFQVMFSRDDIPRLEKWFTKRGVFLLIFNIEARVFI